MVKHDPWTLIFESIVKCCGFSDWPSQLGWLNKQKYLTLGCMGSYHLIAWALVVLTILISSSAFSSNQIARAHFDIWGEVMLWLFFIQPIYSQKWFIFTKNGSWRWSLPLHTSAGASEQELNSFGTGWPCAAPCFPYRVLKTSFRPRGSHCCNVLTAETRAGCLLLPFAVVCYSVLAEMRESDVCCCLEMACRRNRKKRKSTTLHVFLNHTDWCLVKM